MAIVGRAKYTRARATFRGDATRRERRKFELSRARVYFARPTITIAKIRDYSQSNANKTAQIATIQVTKIIRKMDVTVHFNSVNCDHPGECSPEKDCLR